MDSVMLASFMDELTKIAANKAIGPVTSNIAVSSPTKPATVTTGQKPSTSLKSEVKSTNYTVVNSQPPRAAQGTAAQSKAVTPPPVRT